jgi:hypothetical protein
MPYKDGNTRIDYQRNLRTKRAAEGRGRLRDIQPEKEKL